AVLDDFSQFERLEAHASDNAFQQRFRAAKHRNKLALARLIGERLSTKVDPSALFDVQIKRIHEYKRQLLNILEAIALYQAIKDEPQRDWVPRVKIFAGKAAASYRYAKLIIKLINDGANIEIRDHVGAENIAIFGMEAGDVMVRRKQGLDASDVISRSPRLARAITAIESGAFSPGDPARFASIGHALRYLDHYMVSA